MASALIKAVRSVTGAQPAHRRLQEDSAQTFLDGVPVTFKSADSGVNEWDGTTITGAIAGFSTEPASNLTTAGVAKTLTYGSVPNQSGAVKIPAGAPLNDGRIGVAMAVEDTIFWGQTKSDQTPTQANVGLAYGMTKDADNHWYVDLTKTTTSGAAGASEAVVMIVGLGPGMGPAGSSFDTRGVYFKVLQAAQQQLA